MATVIISRLPPPPNGTGSGASQGTDLFPATDTTDTTASASGTTKKYTLSEIYNFFLQSQGLTTYAACRVATTADLSATYDNGVSGTGATLTNSSAQAAIVIDGVTLALTNRVLVKNQASTIENGIYTVTAIGSATTNWVLTRALDYNTPSEIVQYGTVLSNQGTVNAGILWQETAAGPFTIGVTPIVFSAYAASGSVNSGLANQLAYYASSGSTVSGLATANSSGLLTNGSGAPGWVAYTGTGSPVLSTSPTLVTPLLGTPTSGVLTNCTGLPVPGGLSATGSPSATTFLRGDGSWAVPAGTGVTSVSGTANRITSTGGTTPVIDISASYVGQSSITTLGTIGTGLWQGTLVGSTYGGTGVNNGSNTLTLAGNLATSGAFASTFTMTGATSVTFPTSGTLATTGQLPTPAALTEVNDTNVTMTLGGTPNTALLQAVSMTLGWTGQLAVARGGTGVSSVTTAPTATAFAGWDANSNLSANNFLAGFATTVSAAGTTVLTVASAGNQEITGSTTQTIQMPVAATLVAGTTYKIINNSSGNVTINSSGGNAILVMAGNTTAFITLVLASGTSAASWNSSYIFDNGAGVLSITGTANQVNASASTGAVTLSLPQSIATTSSPTFASPTFTGTPALGTPASGVLTNTTGGGGLRSFQIFTSGTAATYTKPANITSILVECVGGGGGGGGSASAAGQAGAAGGGGGGGYCRKYFSSAASTYTYTVGASANGGSAGGNNGTVGNNTTFSTMTATGGSLGAGSGTDPSAGQRASASAGGVPTGGDINVQGGASTPSYCAVTAGVGMSVGGFGGSSFYGPGALGVTSSSASNGNNAPTNSGGGGGGGVSSNGGGTASGGTGAAGIIIVWEFS